MHTDALPRERLYFVDWLRIGAFALLVLRWLPAAWAGQAADGLARPSGWPLLLPVLALGLVRALLFPRFGETHALVDDWAAHAVYLPLFGYGRLLARRRVLLAQLQDLRWPALAFGLAGLAVLVGYLALVPGWPAVPEAWRLPMRWAFAATQWSGIFAAFGFARAHRNRDHRGRAPLTEAVFPLYLVHQTLLILAAVALRPLALPAGLETALIVGITFGGGFLASQLARRIGWLRPWMGLAAWSATQPWPRTEAAP